MMSREFQGLEEEPSELELICIEARKLLEESKMLFNDVKGDIQEFQFNIDCGEQEFDSALHMEKKLATKSFKSGSRAENGQDFLFRLEESMEETESEGIVIPARVDEPAVPFRCRAPPFSKLPMLLKKISIGERSWQHEGLNTTKKSGYLAGTSSGNRSVNEQLPASGSFVKLVDMNEEEWMQYLDNFQKLLYLAFTNCKSGSVGQRQKQRLGTSCRF